MLHSSMGKGGFPRVLRIYTMGIVTKHHAFLLRNRSGKLRKEKPTRGTETQRFNESMQHGDQSTTQSRMKNPYQPQHEIDATIVVCPVVNSRGFVQLGGVSVQSNKVSHNVLRI